MRAFIRVDGFEVHHVSDYVILVGDSVAAVNVASGTRNIESLSAAIALQQRYSLGCKLVAVFEPRWLAAPKADARSVLAKTAVFNPERTMEALKSVLPDAGSERGGVLASAARLTYLGTQPVTKEFVWKTRASAFAPSLSR